MKRSIPTSSFPEKLQAKERMRVECGVLIRPSSPILFTSSLMMHCYHRVWIRLMLYVVVHGSMTDRRWNDSPCLCTVSKSAAFCQGSSGYLIEMSVLLVLFTPVPAFLYHRSTQ